MDPRTELEEAVKKTTLKIERYKAMAGPIAPDNAIGRVSRMDAINNKSVVDAALRKAKERLAGLKRHIDLLGRPEFGLCSKCKKAIPLERILLAPESRFCVTCAS